MRDDVVALYIDPKGPYPKLVKECFDEARDARTYRGSLPVVAHPPCGAWGSLKHLRKSREDMFLAIDAMVAVQMCGGILEHPAMSTFWCIARLPLPGELPDAFGGITIEVEQVRWGHVARKRTWLYMVGIRSIPAMPPSREPTHWVSGSRSKSADGYNSSRTGGAVPPGIMVCSAEQRRRTPPDFARWLVDLAATARKRA